jgi:hypothetical protein
MYPKVNKGDELRDLWIRGGSGDSGGDQERGEEGSRSNPESRCPTKNFDKGVLGKWSFDANGDTTLQQIMVTKIEKGKFVPMKVVSDGRSSEVRWVN